MARVVKLTTLQGMLMATRCWKPSCPAGSVGINLHDLDHHGTVTPFFDSPCSFKQEEMQCPTRR